MRQSGRGGILFHLVLCTAGGAVTTLAIAWASMAFAPSPPPPIGIARPAVLGWPAEPPAPEWFIPSPVGGWEENLWMRSYFGSAERGGVRYALWLHRSGWPLRAMQSEYWVANDHSKSPPRAWGSKRGIRTGLRHRYGDPRLLPTRFLGVGWFVDSLCYGALLLGLTKGPGLIRRSARARRGACTRCGYDLRGNTGACPECGAA